MTGFFTDMKPHILELRNRLIIIIVTLIAFFAIAFTFYNNILDWIIAPLQEVLKELQNSSVLVDGKITTRKVEGAFFVALKVSFFASFIFSLPVILSQIWKFIAPGLYSHEKKLIIPFVLGGTIMFVTGSLFAYYVVTPFGFEFLITFGSKNFIPYINIEDYIGFFIKLMIGFGIAFELPIFILFFAKLGLVTDQTLKDFFRYAIVIILIISAILTPPDVLTQMLMAVPLILLYGISIIIAKVVNPADDENEE